ncbi:MBL fold metallo-hydrolase [Palaeococcus ferrophilus]|uniref:MBL fold metallo-hydrolase n=1 Tax=Palaeococcus ferrophilus TaxID=83868 RepID=UPI00064F52AD|nr:MBL fold metallo-hydrolase [Palaeococcus ferrophilus]
MRITWLGHACFYIETKGVRLLIDPYEDLDDDLVGEVDYVLVTHEHHDHYGKAPLIARLREATLIGPKTVYLMAISDGVTKAKAVEIGEEVELENGVKVLAAYAEHPSSQYPVGYMILGDKVLYHMGDTYSSPRFRDYQKYRVDVLLIPISGRSTASEREAADIIELIRPRMAIPMHYGVYGDASVEEFRKKLFERRIFVRVVEPEFGKPIEV